MKISVQCEHCELIWYWKEDEKALYEDSPTELHRASEEPITETRKEFWCGSCDRFLGEFSETRGLIFNVKHDDDEDIPPHAKVKEEFKKFWLAPHCGPGTEDEDEICGYCGLTYGDCARKHTEAIKTNHSGWCGGSGYWCPRCKRFWAQNICGENYEGELQCKDGTVQVVKDGKNVHCSCGAYLHDVAKPE